MNDQWTAWKMEGVPVDRPTVRFDGIWINKLGSEMSISVEGNTLSGSYRTAVGAPGHYENFPLIGFVNGDLIGFVVDWGKYGSMTSWAGQYTNADDNTGERIETMWYLVNNVAEKDEPDGPWNATLSGSNVFTRK
ncbi:avidin/streptavidin family protein [Arhodomonas sp. AD133]|uniref:avidin/streptavidin family protein n=1 Tax=Arhodomonas sp. AD133 TaxID=3415009 RepID=UPI003EC149AD